MDISSLNSVQSSYLDTYAQNKKLVSTEDDSFSSILNASMNMLEETNDLQNSAEEEEIKFALGDSDNTHDLMIAETKANVALQYTVAVKDGILDAYKEIMQMQI